MDIHQSGGEGAVVAPRQGATVSNASPGLVVVAAVLKRQIVVETQSPRTAAAPALTMPNSAVEKGTNADILEL